MPFNSDVSSSSEAMERGSDLTVKQLHLELEAKPFKWLAKDDPFMTAMTASE